MSSDAIEGEPSHLEANPIFSPSIPTLDVSSKPILDPDDSLYALFPESHGDPRNHEVSQDYQEEQRQRLEHY